MQEVHQCAAVVAAVVDVAVVDVAVVVEAAVDGAVVAAVVEGVVAAAAAERLAGLLAAADGHVGAEHAVMARVRCLLMWQFERAHEMGSQGLRQV